MIQNYDSICVYEIYEIQETGKKYKIDEIKNNVNNFYDIAEKTVSECEHVDEFKSKMQGYENLLCGSSDEEHIDELYSELWDEFWSKYN